MSKKFKFKEEKLKLKLKPGCFFVFKNSNRAQIQTVCCTCSSDPSVTVTFLETGSFIIWQRATEDCWRHDVRRVKKKLNISMMGCSGRSHGDRDADTNTTQGWHIHGHARVQVCKSLTLIDKYYTHMLNTHTHTHTNSSLSIVCVILCLTHRGNIFPRHTFISVWTLVWGRPGRSPV